MKPTKPGFYWFFGTPAMVWYNNGDKLMFHTLHDPTVCEVEHTDATDWGPEIKMGEDVDND